MARDYRLFDNLAPRIMADLLRDVPSWVAEDAAAAVGNAGHECNGFKTMQETKPVVAGSRGGWGWFQWTGPRRRAFEAWAKRQKLDPSSYEANYGFMLVELRGPEKAAVAKTRAAGTLDAKVVAFELAFERAGVKHYPSRKVYARRALKAYEAIHGPRPVPFPRPRPVPKPAVTVTNRTDADVEVDPATNTALIAPPAAAPALTSAEIIANKERLRAKGYAMVGEADEDIGPRTVAAIAAFQKVNGLPITSEFDEVTRKALSNGGKEMTVAPARANASEAEIAAKVPEVAAARKTGLMGLISAVLTGVGVVVSMVKDYAAQAVEIIQPVKEVIDDVPGVVWATAVGGMVIAMWWQSRTTAVAAADAYRKGERT